MNYSRAASRYQVAGGGGRLSDLSGIQPSAFAEQAQMCKIVQNCAKLCKWFCLSFQATLKSNGL
jgi:hypothetical protein